MSLMPQWRYTLDHAPGFYTVAKDVCAFLECNLFDLLGAANAESGVSAMARNPTSSATGLLQWMEMHWRTRWGYTRDEFAALSAEEQLAFVRRYLAPFRGQLGSSAAIYTAVFLPAFVRHAADPRYVLCARSGRLAWAFEANASFDANGDGRIEVGELDEAIRRNWCGPRCAEMLVRAGIGAPTWEPDPNDLRTTYGIQSRLIALGFDLGPAGADNVPGLRTRAAVVAFQKRRGLPADGLVGPKTRAALMVDDP